MDQQSQPQAQAQPAQSAQPPSQQDINRCLASLRDIPRHILPNDGPAYAALAAYAGIGAAECYEADGIWYVRLPLLAPILPPTADDLALVNWRDHWQMYIELMKIYTPATTPQTGGGVA